ncbi:putative RNA-binding protein 46 [Colletes latitarsis]|uniref:putative RNA-binding protein 46 n=1 Tax=Colletes latitarsis TaxID=2605962 RepID=UPI004036E1BD
MSTGVKNDRTENSEKEETTFDLKIEELTEPSNQIHNDKHTKTQLGTVRSIPGLRSVNNALEMNNQVENCLKLLKFIADSKFTLTQVNGQRKLGPPPGWEGPPPGPKCEIFVGSIPRNYYEPDIVHIFNTVGRIYELRLMMDFSGTNRGYCFIMYTTEEEAIRAVKELDQYEIYPGKRIGVVASTNNCRLCVNQLPQYLDSETIVRRFYQATDEVDKVAIYRNTHGFLLYVLVSYKTHRDAAMGRRRLVPEAGILFKGGTVNVEWSNPNMIPSNVVGIVDR